MFASLAKSLKCGEWAYLFATNVANEKILLDIAELENMCVFLCAFVRAKDGLCCVCLNLCLYLRVWMYVSVWVCEGVSVCVCERERERERERKIMCVRLFVLVRVCVRERMCVCLFVCACACMCFHVCVCVSVCEWEREWLCDGPHVCGPNGHFSVRLKRAEAFSTQLIFTTFSTKRLVREIGSLILLISISSTFYVQLLRSQIPKAL